MKSHQTLSGMKKIMFISEFHPGMKRRILSQDVIQFEWKPIKYEKIENKIIKKCNKKIYNYIIKFIIK